MGSAEYPVRSIIITALILLSTHIFPGTCSDRERSGRGPIAVEISRRSRPQASPAVIAVNQRRLSSAGVRTGILDVQDCENSEYSGWIGLGTPMQEFEVVLDTGSYTLWVTSTSCNEGCDSGNKYDSSASTTYEPDGTLFTQSYEDGSEARGILSVDMLSVGGLTTKATFGEMTTRSLDGCKTVDGVMGMGLSSSGDGKNVFETLVDAGVVDVPIFAFFIGDVDTDMPTGVLTLGGVNQTHYEECLRWVSISKFRVDGYWSVDLVNLELGGGSVLETKATAILDTGTSMIVGPYDDVGYLADMIGASCVALVGADSSSVIEVDCLLNPADVQLILMPCDSEFEDLTFQLGWQQFTLTANELLLPLTDFGPANPSTLAEPWCVFGMMGHDSSFWILGDTFLRTFYTAYDVKNKKVGLAKATVNRAGEVCSDDVTISADVVEPAPTSLPSSVDDSSVSGAPGTAPQALLTTSEADPTSTMPGDSTSSSSLDDSEGGSAVTNDTKSSEEGKDEESRGTVKVAAISSILTMIALIACCGIGMLVHRRIRKGTTHRHTQLGVSGKAEGGVEMAGNGVEVIGAGDADDFLQAQPVSYRGNGSGSHRYRVAEEAVAGNNGRASGVTVLGNHGGMIVDDDEEEDDDEVVEVDFGVSNETAAVTPMARLGRMFGRGGRATVGFTAFRDGEDSSDRQQSRLV